RIEPWHLASLLRAHLDQHIDDVLEISALDMGAVNRPRRENSLTSQLNPREVRERAPRPDELSPSPVATRDLLTNSVAHHAPKPAHSFRSDPLLEKHFRETDRAE